ncbi:MAG TPA: DUF4386 family protein [Anaerolineales bacterium]|nr:DUF4386 family protein [Anaerolineales bacterium]
MNSHRSFQRFAALAAIISFPLALGSIVLSGIPVNFSPDVPTNPALWLSVGADGANLSRWGMILDMFSYYLPLLPVALFLWRWLGSRNPDWVLFYTSCGLGYILIGAIGAAILAAVHPPLINAYAQASVEQRPVLETVFSAVWNMVYGGMWNILEVLLAGIWFLGIGLLLRSERRLFSIFSIILGISALLDSLGFILGIEAFALLGVAIYVLLAPVWALWIGIDLLRKPVQIQATYN